MVVALSVMRSHHSFGKILNNSPSRSFILDNNAQLIHTYLLVLFRVTVRGAASSPNSTILHQFFREQRRYKNPNELKITNIEVRGK